MLKILAWYGRIGLSGLVGLVLFGLDWLGGLGSGWLVGLRWARFGCGGFGCIGLGSGCGWWSALALWSRSHRDNALDGETGRAVVVWLIIYHSIIYLWFGGGT